MCIRDRDKWLQSQKVRAKLLFEQFPDIKSVYYYACLLYTSDEGYPLLIEKNHFRIVLLNYTYGTNGIEVTPPMSVADQEAIKALFPNTYGMPLIQFVEGEAVNMPAINVGAVSYTHLTHKGVESTKLMPVQVPSSTRLMNMVMGSNTSFSSSTKRL